MIIKKMILHNNRSLKIKYIYLTIINNYYYYFLKPRVYRLLI